MFSFVTCRSILGLFLWLTVTHSILSEAAWTSSSPAPSWILRRCYAARGVQRQSRRTSTTLSSSLSNRDHWQHHIAQSARPERRQRRGTHPTATTTAPTRLSLAGQQPPDLWDRFRNSLPDFLQDRSGDFVPLKDENDSFDSSTTTTTTQSQQPMLVLDRVPAGIHDDEIYDMLTDGAPVAVQQGVQIRRLSSSSSVDTEPELQRLLDAPLGEALVQLQPRHRDPDDAPPPSLLTEVAKYDERSSSSSTTTNNNNNNNGDDVEQQQQVAVLLFSGFTNTEMLQTYRILAPEIAAETSGQCLVACAKVVPRARDKPMRQVLEEIASDHRNAVTTLPNDNN